MLYWIVSPVFLLFREIGIGNVVAFEDWEVTVDSFPDQEQSCLPPDMETNPLMDRMGHGREGADRDTGPPDGGAARGDRRGLRGPLQRIPPRQTPLRALRRLPGNSPTSHHHHQVPSRRFNGLDCRPGLTDTVPAPPRRDGTAACPGRAR